MGRSGTTLLEKLLCNHNQLSVLSQPIPLLFVDIKKRFLNSIGIDKYYVLNDSINNKDYDPEAFNSFINNFKYSKEEAETIFYRMTKYSGQQTQIGIPSWNFENSNFLNLFLQVNKNFAHNKNARHFGSKEILCEEFSSFFINNDIKVIIIVRDPRDVLASANYPNSVKFVGQKKPSLFVLRSWRKSIDFIKAFKSNTNLLYLRYEDLVVKTDETLRSITSFLGVDSFVPNTFNKGILDQNGNIWKANSSNNLNSINISSNSIGKYKKKLSISEIAYAEAICFDEMEYFNYDVTINRNDRTEVIKNFIDFDIQNQTDLPSDYSSSDENINFEISRFKR